MAIFLAICMLAGFLVSRAVLSIAMILFGVNALWNINPKKWLKEKWWLWGAAWITLFALSYFWSDDKSYWVEHLQVKLPILLLPLSFSFLPSFNTKQVEAYTLALCLCLLAGVCYSMYFLITNPGLYVDGYNFSNVLPTLPENEHIRFTLALSLGTIWCIYIYPHLAKRSIRLFTGLCVIIFSIAIHIFAVRTGILTFYLFVACYLGYLFVKKQTRVIALVCILSITIASILAFQSIPTLKNRVRHFKWSLMIFEKGEMNPNYGDIGRYISYDLAVNIIRSHPILGVGAGDIFTEMDKEYETHYPQVKKELRLVPHNQFLVVAVAGGFITLIVFTIWIFYPLVELKRNRTGFFFLVTWLVLMVPILVEPVLEIQFGIYVYIVFLLWQRQVMLKPIIRGDR